jgi:lysozyme family protein
MFRDALGFTLRWEGGFVDDPDDPGGRTNRGVTQRSYDSWRSGKGSPPRDVKLISDDEVEAIYQHQYWRTAGCDRLGGPLDLITFDTAVNMGVRRSVKILQTALGCPADGQFGPMTARAAGACDVVATAAACCRIREGIYQSLVAKNPALSKFLNGWLRRVASLRSAADLPGGATRGGGDVTGGASKIPDLAEDQPLEPWE